MSTPVQTSTTDLEISETSNLTILLADYIKNVSSDCSQIITVECKKPAITRQQLKTSFEKPICHGAFLVSSSNELVQLMSAIKRQLIHKEKKTAVLPLILLAPSRWPNFHEIMLDILDLFVGPIFLVDNSCAAANWADHIISVATCGKVKPQKTTEMTS